MSIFSYYKPSQPELTPNRLLRSSQFFLLLPPSNPTPSAPHRSLPHLPQTVAAAAAAVRPSLPNSLNTLLPLVVSAIRVRHHRVPVPEWVPPSERTKDVRLHLGEGDVSPICGWTVKMMMGLVGLRNVKFQELVFAQDCVGVAGMLCTDRDPSLVDAVLTPDKSRSLGGYLTVSLWATPRRAHAAGDELPQSHDPNAPPPLFDDAGTRKSYAAFYEAAFNSKVPLCSSCDSSQLLEDTVSASGDESFTNSTDAFSHSTSGSTIPGPGALSGKAILALGKATLRGAEFIIIRRRLNAIAGKFPLPDTVNIKGLEEMYDDLLELSRLHLYAGDIRDKALQILLFQISHRDTRHFAKCLNKWPDVEIQIFLSELMTTLDPIRLSHPDVKSELSIKAYKGGLSAWESHSLAPIVDFLGQWVQSSSYDSSILFQAGILDLFLHMYVTNFRDPLADTEHGAIHRTSTLSSACNFLLTGLCGTKTGIASVSGHVLRALWPTRPEHPFTVPLGIERVQQRIDAWTTASRPVILWWLHATFDMMLDFTRIIDDSVMHDVCPDLLELAACGTVDIEVQMRALRSLHRVFTRGSIVAQRIIREYLLLQNPAHSVKIVSCIISNLSRIIPIDSAESKFFFLQWDHNDHNVVPHFLHLFLNLAKNDKSILNLLLDADVLGLMRPFLEFELRNNPESRMAVHEGELLTVYDPSDAVILEQIKERSLEELMTPFPQDSTRAFDVFLGREDRRPFPKFRNVD
ncbi:hypothetical protein DXG01_016527 [Tephrocybe rancida]|nr:hypothetical protein DXG01_016527 [Tephrocybe rancida]